MKIGILSMQRVNNMGSLLQAYVLQETIRRFGHQVEFIDIVNKPEDDSLLGKYRLKYPAEGETAGLIGKFKKIDKYLFTRIKEKTQVVQQNTMFEDFRNRQLSIEKRSLQYDVCVIGSDEVFNCLRAGKWGFTSQLFGNVPQARKVITYAASCGATEYEAVPAGVADRIRETFEHVSAFSVRDRNTRDFVARLTDKSVSCHADPVLIYDFGREMGNALLPELPARCCVIYSYYNRIHSREEMDAISHFCRRHRLTPVAVGAPQFWVKRYIVCSPFQCLKVFQKADFVFTDTFHGTIFASRYAERFAVLARESNRHKVEDLVERIGIQEHLMKNITELEKMYTVHKNVERLATILKSEKEKALQYLEENL